METSSERIQNKGAQKLFFITLYLCISFTEFKEEFMGKKRLTPRSHYEASILLDRLLNGKVPEYINWEIKYEHLQILRMFIIDGMNAQEISKSGIIKSNRGKNMDPDTILVWLHKYIPNIEYDEVPSTSRRSKDLEMCRTFARLRETLPKTPCVICGSTEELELDHIVPYFRGGATAENNLQWLCKSCHQKKTNEEIEQAGWFELSPLRMKKTS